ncbi:DUF881 domain-containing protein [Candidatus Peregrinibacteria bacterium]|nr:DUF881 domain-containing protein [Candidatus Peregrinibacteria bacterium]
MAYRKVYIALVAVVLGFFIITQGRSFENATEILRDGEDNVFQELKILKEKNVALRREIEDLEAVSSKLTDQNLAISTIKEEIAKYKKLSGKYPIFGQGLVITVKNEISTPWVIDLVNELFSTGAEAVSLNGVRIVNFTAGIDTLPQGQLLINGSILSQPYTFQAIGDGKKLLEILQLPGGIIDRLEANFAKISINIEIKDVIQM